MTTFEKKNTPMMEQWHQCKKEAKDALLLFRMGDFYEAFYEDAVILARTLDLTLTKRQEIPMAGVPWHSAESYIDRLISNGYKIAIAEQLEDPKVTKGLVKRGIVQMLTPGTHLASSTQNEKKNHFIVAISQVGSFFGLAICDLTTASFVVQEHESEKDLLNELFRLQPGEVVTTKKFQEKYKKSLDTFYLTLIDEWSFDHKMAYAFLVNHFKVAHLDGFGLKGKVAPINAAGALLSYLKEGLSHKIDAITHLRFEERGDYLSLDSSTLSHLEFPALLELIDKTETPMGGRCLAQWLKKPLYNVEKIQKRQDALSALLEKPFLLSELRPLLRAIRDLERLIMKVVMKTAGPKDLVALRASLLMIHPLKESLQLTHGDLFNEIKALLLPIEDLISYLTHALVDEPPLRLHEGEVFKDGFDSALDELKDLSRNGKHWLSSYQNRLKDETGIKTLKIIYNKIFGYTIEVSRGGSKMMPEGFERRQTLANCERYTTQELKEYESKVFSAEEKKESLEKALYEKVLEHTSSFREKIFTISKGVALLDCLYSLAEVAVSHNYTRPLVDHGTLLEIKEGRHPILEHVLSKECFIPNSTKLDDENHLMVITGPNMAGKSTYIRQVALLVILAQMGSFVPAAHAHIGLVDKIFTRIGAGDDLTRGQSTFMVEMSETANILNHVTSRSLVILDEIGRGTSTYDGLSIAWSVAEYLLSKKTKTLFATHYFELTALEETNPGALNFHAAVKEFNEEIVFLHKIARGGADRSYGIHVARLAGLPQPVISRAQEILVHLEQKGSKRDTIQKMIEKKTKEKQLTLF
jgi:DNA mismatch repair protein MutS